MDQPACALVDCGGARVIHEDRGPALIGILLAARQEQRRQQLITVAVLLAVVVVILILSAIIH